LSNETPDSPGEGSESPLVKQLEQILPQGDIADVTSEWLDERSMPWCMRDNAGPLLKSGEPFVLNLDDTEGNGTHWVAVRRIGDTLLYADPFGSRYLNGYPPKEINIYPRRVVSTKAFQHPNTNYCGYYAYLFAKKMKEIKSIPKNGNNLSGILEFNKL